MGMWSGLTTRADGGLTTEAAVMLRHWPSQVEEYGAGEGIRTLDPNLGKVVLYP
jgi:hypothetical protein